MAVQRIPIDDGFGGDKFGGVETGKTSFRLEDFASSLGPRKGAAFLLSVYVGLAIAIVTGGILVFYLVRVSNLPNLPTPLTFQDSSNTNYGELVKVYDAVNNGELERALRIFSVIVTSAFLPVFTSLLGYIFGSGEAKKRLQEFNKKENQENTKIQD